MKAMYIRRLVGVEFKDIEMPVRKKGEVLLKILYGGLRGSDLEALIKGNNCLL